MYHLSLVPMCLFYNDMWFDKLAIYICNRTVFSSLLINIPTPPPGSKRWQAVTVTQVFSYCRQLPPPPSFPLKYYTNCSFLVYFIYESCHGNYLNLVCSMFIFCIIKVGYLNLSTPNYRNYVFYFCCGDIINGRWYHTLLLKINMCARVCLPFSMFEIDRLI